jgi:hypothetical protein
MSILSASAHCHLVIASICLFPFSAQSAAPKEKPIDLSIIKQSDALHPYMSFPQRQAYVRAAELVEQGQSDIRSGQNLQLQKPSALDPNRDLKQIHERGERLEIEGQAKINEGQRQLVAILTLVQTQRTAEMAIAAKKYNFDLIEFDYQTALEQAALQTLETCRAADYQNIFFDCMQLVQSEQTTKAPPTIHNALYDTLIQADGTQFNLKVSHGLKLEQDANTGKTSFHYDNVEAFDGEKNALLAIELIAPGEGIDAVLALRAFDIDSQQLISSVLFAITDASNVLNTKAAEPKSITIPTIPDRVSFSDPDQIIDKLAGLKSPYQFEILSAHPTNAHSILVSSLLKDTLFKHSSIILVESDFIQRTYLSADEPSNGFLNAATGALSLSPNGSSYTLTAEAYGSDRTLEVGTITLHLSK